MFYPARIRIRPQAGNRQLMTDIPHERHPVDAPAGIIFAADATTAVAGVFNAAWLVGHWLRTAARGCRLAALSLATVNAGIAAQAAYAQALYSAHRFGWPEEPLFSATPWLAARLPLLAGTLLLTALIIRRVR
jgi:hypothetical protein